VQSHAAADQLFRYDLPIEEDPIRLVLDRRVPWIVHGEMFSQQSLGTGPWPDQGWKLHVSATPLSAVPVLEAALEVLLAQGARFKVVNSISHLGTFNFGLCGISQIGKFITVYPNDDDHAVQLAVALDEATRGLRGPRVPTDRPLRPGSLVHYRYGSILPRSEAHDAGAEGFGSYDLLDPAGRLTDDYRLEYYEPPAPEIVDPFEAAGVREPPPIRGRLLNGRYLVVHSLGCSARGGVFRALDVGVKPARLCLLKEAWHDVGLDPWGRDARDWATNEAQVLARFGDDSIVPRFYDRFDVDDDRYVAIEYIDGSSLDRVLADEYPDGQGIAPAEVVAIGLATADALARLHELGIVFRDLKPANLIKTPEGDYRLIDFGIAYRYLEDSSEPLSIGTPPFYSPEQFGGARPSPADDVFAWGTVLYHLAGGDATYEQMPKGDDFQKPFPRRPLAEVRPSFPPELAAVIDRAVAWEPGDRFETMAEARAALADASTRLDRRRSSGVDAAVPVDGPGPEPVGADEALVLARAVGDALCAAAEEADGGLRWQRRLEWSEQTAYSPDLYAGAAGIGLFLAELARTTGEERYADVARGAARWIAGPTWGRGRAQHGLHDGEAGIAYFFLRLAELLEAPGYVTAAELRMRRLRGAAARTIDLMYGTAGTLLGSLALHAMTADAEYLADAVTAGDELLASARTPEDGPGSYWDVPWPAPGRPVTTYLGLMHGVAGIAFALAQLGVVAGEERFVAAARSSADLLLARANETPEGLLTWPRHLGDSKQGLQALCHGAGGVGQFLLALDRVAPDPRYRPAAEAAGRTVAAQRPTETRSGLCHGLSGIGEAMLDCYQALGDARWLDLAGACAGGLRRFRIADQPGVYAMSGDDAVSPDLMVGYAGIGSFLLRLADPRRAPDLVLGSLANALR
jgi:hypothetical protein